MNVSDSDDSHMSDVLCTLKIGPTLRLRRSTDTKPKTVNCVWEQVFMFEDAMLTHEEFQSEKVSIGVYDRNNFTANELIGSFEFSLSNVYRQRNHEYYRKWTPMLKPHEPKHSEGWVLLSIYVLKDGDPTPNHDINDVEDGEILAEPNIVMERPNLLNVLVYKGASLQPTYNSSLNPFVSVRFNGNTIQSQHIPNVANPTWNRRFQMPFHMPLSSDSIEVQVWNKNTGVPDTLIGSATFSYFQLRLTHRSWGPKWINLYSPHFAPPKTTFLGRLLDVVSGTAGTAVANEWVGRILVRMSVTPIKGRVQPRLLAAACNPTAEPDGAEYAVQLVLYQCSELPVMGGKVSVELAFGSQRRVSEAVIGREGVFTWNQVIDPCFLYCPKDLDQVHDVIISVYHEIGKTARKVAFERIPVRQLLPMRYYYVNGDVRVINEWTPWTPRWRSLQHVAPDPKRPHVVAGFLMCAIGFGLRKHMPARPPKIIKAKPDVYTLTCDLHHAANLRPANASGSCDPIVVLRYAGVTTSFSPQTDTRFPFWYERRHMNVHIDRRRAPSVYLMVYHKTTFGQQLLGRAEMLTQDVLDNPGKLWRLPLSYEQHARFSRAELDEHDAHIPYVLCSFRLSLNHDFELGDPIEYEEKWDYEPPTRDYTVKIESIGLRNVTPPILASPHLYIDFPSLPGKDSEEPRVFSLDKPKGGSISFMENIVLPDISLPVHNLYSVPLRIRLFEHGMTGNTLIGAHEEPVANFIHGTVDRPDFYVYLNEYEDEHGTGKANEDEDDEDDEEGAEGKMAGDNGGEDDDDDPAAQLRRQLTQASMMSGDSDATGAGDTGGTGGGTTGAPSGATSHGDVYLDLDEDEFNIDEVVATKPDKGTGERNLNKLRKVEEAKDEIGNEIELRDEYSDDKYVYKEFILRRGPAIGGHGSSPMPTAATSTSTAVAMGFDSRHFTQRTNGAVLKCFIRVAPKGLDQDMLVDDMLQPIENVYSQPYVARIYVYRGINLTPTGGLMSGRKQCNPYLVVTNGNGDEHVYNDRVNHRTDDQHPDFYRVFELPTELPANNALQIAVWDVNDFGGDSMIGSTTIDVEWRLLRRLNRGDMEYRMLTRPESSISHGKVLMRLELLTMEEARRIKAEDLRPPEEKEYELRMVLWRTEGVRMPEEKDKNDSVDQKMYVTTNFTGEYGKDTIKETDVAWYSSGGEAEWNYRMVYRVTLPCKVPRMKISIWDENITSSDESIGEVLYNLKPFFDKALREKQPITHQDQRLLPFSHPNYRTTDLGGVYAEFWLLTQTEADQFPVGEAQDEPNRMPYLPDPKRNPPPWAVGTRGMDWLAKRKRLIACLCVIGLVGPILLPLVLTQMTGSVL
eukprot:TRINITY_DN66894_c5_g6_i1.p1 TRINITY_DN66894_c5_g6~~TRINITY_DN66894_c5_g6_i1.p1  ORF type:complete len:1357 (-),score=756.79 TRINITY_DN66894_c5_g6_i1:54-4124(-)